MARSLFPKRLLEEEGQVNTFNMGSYFLAATYSENITGTKDGTVFHMFDGDTTTIMSFSKAGAGAWVRWDFIHKQKLRNIYMYLSAGGIAAGTHNVILQGSDNNSDWDDIDTQNCGGYAGDTCFELLGTNVNYRYYRVYSAVTDAAHWVYIRQAKAVR